MQTDLFMVQATTSTTSCCAVTVHETHLESAVTVDVCLCATGTALAFLRSMQYACSSIHTIFATFLQGPCCQSCRAKAEAHAHLIEIACTDTSCLFTTSRVLPPHLCKAHVANAFRTQAEARAQLIDASRLCSMPILFPSNHESLTLPVFAYRKRRHVPISYKPPEKQPSGTDPSQSDAAKRDSRLDKKGSGADRADAMPREGSGLETRPSDLARNVSRTESGQKLSVFERLQR